jgi:hypothetical protein
VIGLGLLARHTEIFLDTATDESQFRAPLRLAPQLVDNGWNIVREIAQLPLCRGESLRGELLSSHVTVYDTAVDDTAREPVRRFGY